ncbi:MAG: Choline-sulfatase [uncultured Chloroflexi bacterium]|uniref:Choline-sulfatase n=1 Tax=uncultured Chloroflexota bacterium TaxID=166587 RepID=A0A6J4JTH7_9CHLR|nr:MAG: Choline-sulfatase [uncultured Chloroflexota bacterium]
MEQIDEGIGAIVRALRDGGILDNTLIVISADHGELLGDHGGWGKRSFYEGSVTVPLLMHWPAGLPGGAIRQAPVSTVDVFPTFLAAAGIQVTSSANLPDAPKGWVGLDGLNLLPAARDGALPDRPGIAAEYGSGRTFKLMWRWDETAPSGGPGSADHRWKYVWLANGGREQLFDLAADPEERQNLASTDTGRCRQAHDALAHWCTQTDFDNALDTDGRLISVPFEPFPLGQVKERQPAWVSRDPDFNAEPAATA